MAAIPIVAASVSAVGTLSSINQANKQANAQASAIANERTTALINTEIAQANIRQQDKIASAQNEISVLKVGYDSQMAAKNAGLQRDAFAFQQESNKVVLEQQRLLLQTQKEQTQSQLELQRISATNETRKGEVQVQAQLADGQSQLSQPNQQTQQLAKLVNNTRALNAMGTSGNPAIRQYLEQQNEQLRAGIQEFANESSRVTTETDYATSLIDKASAADQAALNADVNASEVSINNTEAQVDNQNTLADAILKDYNASIDVLKQSQLTDIQFAEELRKQQLIAQQRATREGLSSNMTSLDAQARGIQRPGIADLLGGGYSAFSIYNNLSSQQAAVKQRGVAVSQSPANQPYQNPRYDSTPTGYGRNSPLSTYGSNSVFNTRDLTPDGGYAFESNPLDNPLRVIEFKAPGVI